ncbi:MAG: hypothetical protein KJP12_01170 [Acidimicrobiia bacterium]|nr:hypothetical protein [Acidimicrobiia bacterium]
MESAVTSALDALGVDYQTMPCDPEFADTAAFCERYGIAPEDSANAIVLASKRPQGVYAMFLVLAVSRLDVNGRCRSLMDVKKVSFADAETTRRITGMEIGGVTPFGASGNLPVFVDAAVMERTQVVVGGGSRAMKVTVAPDAFTAMGATVVEDLAARIQ